MTYGDMHNNSTDLFAVVNIGRGQVLHQTRTAYIGADVVSLSKWIDAPTQGIYRSVWRWTSCWPRGPLGATIGCR